jgi:hypothetical protein
MVCGGVLYEHSWEEKLLIEHARTAKSLKHLYVDPHFEFVISGRTKGNKTKSHKSSVPSVRVREG